MHIPSPRAKILRSIQVVMLAVVAAGCGARQAASTPQLDTLAQPADQQHTQFMVAESRTMAARNETVAKRLRLKQCDCSGSLSAQRVAALKEARQLVRRAESAPESEQAALDKRAGELLQKLQEP